MKMAKAKSFLGCLAVILFSGCNNDSDVNSQVDEALNNLILEDFSQHVAQSVYENLETKTSQLYDQVLSLKDNPDDDKLATCQQTWRDARQAWEQSEAFLFGPVATENIDPRIDTWPVNFNDLEAQLASSNEFTESYIDDLEDALKGFHPIEYLLFGGDSDKSAVDFTEREMDYLEGLTKNLKKLTGELADDWDDTDDESYHHEFTTAGSGSTIYDSQLAALEELVNGMAGICDEVANGKISEPFLQSDPSLEESPFAKNSITDFTNNIRGVENVYLGKYAANGKGLEDLVRNFNLQLDSEIKLKINAAIAALDNITVSFGEAITAQPIQVQNAIDAINELSDVLNEKLLPFVQQHAK